MSQILLADDIGPGGTAFFIVLALIAAVIVIFWAMFGSLRRLKQSVARGAFGEAARQADEDAESAAIDLSKADRAAIRDPAGRDDAGV